VLLAVGLAISGVLRPDEKPDPKLAALKREPLAKLTLSGGRVVLLLELEEHNAWSKPITAEIQRVFAFDDRTSARKGRIRAIEAARSSGWHVNLDRQYATDPFWGSKTLATGEATLSIADFKSEGVWKVSIQLEHTPCTALCGR
jgi:hypothetical protein